MYTAQIHLPFSPLQIWEFLLQFSRRAEWEWSLKGVRMEGSLQKGAAGTFLKMFGSDRSFQILELEPEKQLMLSEAIPGGTLHWNHRLEENEGGTLLILELSPQGLGRYWHSESAETL